ncbi:NDP-sugar synthase [Thermodesulfobacteriota bacterium]
MKAGILAAGAGSRFVEAGWKEPKPLIELQGRPIVSHVLEGLFRAGIDGVEILLNGKPRFDPVEAYVKQLPESQMIRVWRKTTPSSFASFRFLMDRLGSPPYLLTTVDTIFLQEDLDAFIRQDAYPPSCGLALAVTDFVHDTNPLWADLEEGGRIRALGESTVVRSHVTAGLYLVLKDLADRAKGQTFPALRAFLQSLVLDGEAEVYGRVFRRALDIDSPEDIEVAESVLNDINKSS